MSLRIRAICGMLEDNIILADIGTDHALLPILAVESGKAIRAYACDVAAGPLLQAEANIREKGLTDQIKAIRSDGFDYVPQDADTALFTPAALRQFLRRAQDLVLIRTQHEGQPRHRHTLPGRK